MHCKSNEEAKQISLRVESGRDYVFRFEDEKIMKEFISLIDVCIKSAPDKKKDSNWKINKFTSFRHRSPSPSNRARRPSGEQIIATHKEKEKKTWKGKMVKQWKKFGGQV